MQNLIINKPYYIICTSIKEVKASIKYAESLWYTWDPSDSTKNKHYKRKYVLLHKAKVWWAWKEYWAYLWNAELIEVPIEYIRNELSNREMFLNQLIPYLKDSFFWDLKPVQDLIAKYIRN